MGFYHGNVDKAERDQIERDVSYEDLVRLFGDDEKGALRMLVLEVGSRRWYSTDTPGKFSSGR